MRNSLAELVLKSWHGIHHGEGSGGPAGWALSAVLARYLPLENFKETGEAGAAHSADPMLLPFLSVYRPRLTPWLGHSQGTSLGPARCKHKQARLSLQVLGVWTRRAV